MVNKVFLCLGGNLGDRFSTLEKCRNKIETHCGKILLQSKVYETEAWGSDSKKPYLNQVVFLKTTLGVQELLLKLLSLERSMGRKRTASKNADRVIDIDILFYNDLIHHSEDLEVPHPRIQLRKFVLKPLMDIATDYVHPELKKTVKKLYSECQDKLIVNEYKPYKYICIEGNIGSGKSTLAKALSKSLNAVYIPEQFEKNDLLPLFYNNPKTFAFPLEYSFLLNRYQQLETAFKQNKCFYVSDYSIFKCLWFAKVNLSKKDFLFFKKHFNAIEQQLPKPDLIIYIDAPVDEIKKNIKKRGRTYEQNIGVKYLNDVAKNYRKGINSLDSVNVLNIIIDKYHKGLSKELINSIKKSIQ